MEEINKKKLFLAISYGYGKGYGSGSGSSNGNGSGYGYGSGDGYGSGFSYGSGDSSGDGNGRGYSYGSGDGSRDGRGNGRGSSDGRGLKKFNGQRVYMIDDIPTLIDIAHDTYAKGRILQSDLTTKPCYIAKVGNYFAHGNTLREARVDAHAKYEKNRPLNERIFNFNKEYPDRNKKVDAAGLFHWHHVLTGSCFLGRKLFCDERGLDYEHGMYTVNEFIALTREAYGKEAIQELERTLP